MIEVMGTILMAAAGIAILLRKKRFLDWFIGLQILFMSVSLFSVLVSSRKTGANVGYIGTWVFIFIGVLILSVSFALMIRQVYTNRRGDMAGLRKMRN